MSNDKGPDSDELDGAGGASGPGLAPAPDSDSEEPGRAAAAGHRAKVLPVLAPSSGGNQPWERSNQSSCSCQIFLLCFKSQIAL